MHVFTKASLTNFDYRSLLIFNVDFMSDLKSLREKDLRNLLFLLIKCSRRSDRDIAKSTGLSQPSISRKRQQLEKKGYIDEYTINPNLTKIGYELIVFTMLDFIQPLTKKSYQKAKKWVENQPSILFWADGEGAGIGSIMVSVQKNYADFSKLMSQFRLDWQYTLKSIQNFYVSLNRKELVIRPFSFGYLQDNE